VQRVADHKKLSETVQTFPSFRTMQNIATSGRCDAMDCRLNIIRIINEQMQSVVLYRDP
jgi:hypothetical protein